MEELGKKLDILLNRTKDLEKLQTLVNEINCRLIDVEKKLSDVDQKSKTAIKDVETKVNARVDIIEKSTVFISSEYDGQKKSIVNLLKRDTEIKTDLNSIHSKLAQLENDLEQEKAARNDDAQHARSSTHAKIHGIPIQTGEDDFDQSSSDNAVTRALIIKLASVAKMSNFEEDQIDVCHRVGADSDSPIIIRFKCKRDRMNFFKQRKSVTKIQPTDLNCIEFQPSAASVRGGGNRGRGGVRGGRGASRGGGSRPAGGGPIIAGGGDNDAGERGPIFIQESLTKYSSDLLKSLKAVTNGKNYKYGGYIFNGQIRAKVDDDSKFIRIRCKSDFSKL